MSNHIIKVYSIPGCHYCDLVKEYLYEKNLEYTEIDVSKDTTAFKEMVTKSAQASVPVIEIDGGIIVGFDKSSLEEIFKE
jgi:glutaredoxin-like YruB-family protein